MDFVNKLSGGGHSNTQGQTTQSSQGGGGIMGKVNNALGGGHSGENNEDALDKGVDLVQEHGFGQGQQKNESAVEQAKDEKISDGFRSAYKKVAGKDVPIADK